jgi:hypothetical protein
MLSQSEERSLNKATNAGRKNSLNKFKPMVFENERSIRKYGVEYPLLRRHNYRYQAG